MLINAVPETDRTKFLGGSDCAAILGVSKWRTALETYQDKILPRVNEERDVMTRGKKLEPFLFQQFQEDTGIELVAHGQRYKDREHSFLACEIDAETISKENVEIKTVHPLAAGDWGDPGSDDIPIYYAAQVMHGLMVTCRSVAIVYAAIGFDDRRVYRVERDEETIAAIREKEVAFWLNHVVPRIPPEPVTASDVLLLYGKDSGRIIDADSDPHLSNLLDRLAVAKRVAKDASDEYEQIENAVKLLMRDATAVMRNGKTLATWKEQNSRRFQQKEFAAAHPALAEQFMRTQSYRVFRLK